MVDFVFSEVKRLLLEDTEVAATKLDSLSVPNSRRQIFIDAVEKYKHHQLEQNEYQLAIINRDLTRGISIDLPSRLESLCRMKQILLECNAILRAGIDE